MEGGLSPGVESPCTNVCRMDGETCIGCYRTLDEIVRWSAASDDEKRQILDAVAVRRAQDSSGRQVGRDGME
jgi:predicted Fe-S protein YdhL (DUF1289 family)